MEYQAKRLRDINKSNIIGLTVLYMGGQSSFLMREGRTNRMPVISPRHLPQNMSYESTAYAKFNPSLYTKKFSYPAKEPPKYW